MYRCRVALTTSLFAWALAVAGSAVAQVTADDVVPVAKDGAREIKQPDRVESQGNVVRAATAQDAVNAAVDQDVKRLENEQTPTLEAVWVKFPSGWGIKASGVATYRSMADPTASRIAQHMAYRVAFIQAKKTLAEFLEGLDNEGKEVVRQTLTQVNTDNKATTLDLIATEETNRQAIRALLRGFVIYQTKDLVDKHTVAVWIVTTPKTVQKCLRFGDCGVGMQSATLKDGIDEVLAELRQGFFPGLGNRIIAVKGGRETAFVGFGSAVVSNSQSPSLQAKLRLNAQKIAASRAKDSLCAALLGEEISAVQQRAHSTTDQEQESTTPEANDPLAKDDPQAGRQLSEVRKAFLAGG